MKNDTRKLEIALGMPDVEITLTSKELAALGQMTGTLAHLGMYVESHGHNTGKFFFDEAQRVLNEHGVEREQGEQMDSVLARVESANIPDVTLKISVAGLVALAGTMAQFQDAYMSVGGEMLIAWSKLFSLARSEVKKIQQQYMMENSSEPNMKPAKA